MKKHILLVLFLFSFSLLSGSAFAKNSLIGNWKSSKIKLNLKSNHHYSYSVKILGISKKFTGTWSTKIIKSKSGKKKNILVLTYNLFGKHTKTAQYSFTKGKLKLIQDGKTSYLKKS